jgi:hypothetical protein
MTVPEHAAQAFDVGSGPVGEVAQSTLTDLVVLSVALAQENGRGCMAKHEHIRRRRNKYKISG